MLPKKVTVLAVISPKGGSGKTTTTANIAVAMSEFHKKYILALDTNITTASLGIHLGIMKPPVTLIDVIKKDFSILEAMYFYNKYLQIIPSNLAIEIKGESIVFPEKIKKLTHCYRILLSDLVKRYDKIIIDSAPGFGLEAVAAMQAADALLLVTNPELPAVMVSAKVVEYAKILKKPIVGIVLNKVKKKFYELNKEDVEESLGVPVIAEIPNDEKVPESIAKRIPVVLYAKRSSASLAYRKLAADMLGEECKIDTLSRIKTFFRGLR
jgi:septum site-determining protein MinD